jgi:hypothetical protein
MNLLEICGRGAQRCAVVLALVIAAEARAEIRRLEAVGTVPVHPGIQKNSLRDAARDAGLAEAVRRVARDQLDPARSSEVLARAPTAGSAQRPDAESRLDAVLDEALGARALDYLSRFRILEDRGPRASLFSEEGGAESEYVVVVEALVDSDRVRARLERRGLPLVPEVPIEARRLTLEIVDLQDFRSLGQLSRVLAERLRMAAATPVEMQRGRAVLEVPSERDAAGLAIQLRDAAAPELAVEIVRAEGHHLVLRLRPSATAAAPPASSPPSD